MVHQNIFQDNSLLTNFWNPKILFNKLEYWPKNYITDIERQGIFTKQN
jgi:hypothetical protein